ITVLRRAVGQMRMAIDKAGKDSAVREIDNGGVGRNGQALADRFKFVVADDDDLIREYRGVVGIDEAASFDSSDLGGGKQIEQLNAEQCSFHRRVQKCIDPSLAQMRRSLRMTSLKYLLLQSVAAAPCFRLALRSAASRR